MVTSAWRLLHRRRRSDAVSVVAALACVLLLLLGARSHAAPGDLDPTFGTGGLVTTPTGTTNTGAQAVAVQVDGKIVAAGRDNGSIAVARYLTDGTLDTTFGTGGVVFTPGGPSAAGNAVAIQTDGKIVVAGTMGTYPSTDFAVVRYLTDGSLDPGFGTSGIVTTNFGASVTSSVGGVAIQADGKIVAAGFAGSVAAIAEDFAVVRYSPDGSLDASFGSGGTVLTSFVPSFGNPVFAGASAVALQGDGKIVAAGEVTQSSTPTITVSGPALARYNTDGSLDTSFGSGGTIAAPLSLSSGNALSAVALQADGDIVGAGNSLGPALIRYLPTGALDPAFGASGVASLPVDVTSLAIQGDGEYVAAGGTNGALTVVRVMSTGSLDFGFGTGGIAYALFPAPYTTFTTAHAVAIQGDGKIVAAGILENSQSAQVGFALARFLIGAGGLAPVCAPVGGSRNFLSDPRPKLVMTGLGTSGGGGLRLSVDFLLPAGLTFSSLDPITGARLVIESTTAMPRVDLTLPGDKYGGTGTRGWTVNAARTTWTYTDSTSSPIGGLIAMTIRDRSKVAPGLVQVSLKGRGGTYPVAPGDLPVQVFVVLGQPAAGLIGECGQSNFAASDCHLGSRNTKLTCR